MIKITNVSHIYSEASQSIHALEQVSLNIACGELVSLIGQSGCGKSTLLKIVAALLIPTQGQVTIDDIPANEARAKRKFGMVFQNPVLFPWRTVRENILLPFELRASNANKLDQEIEKSEEQFWKVAKLVGLEDFWNSYPSQLSGGMQARVAIARALGYRPDVMLMDEPFGSLDEITRTKLNEHLLTLQKHTGITIFLVTHSLREAAFLSNRVAVLSTRPGHIQAVFDVPNVVDKLFWRETREFSEFCRELQNSLE